MEAFTRLKEAVTQPLVLALLDFSRPFLIECDASGSGLGAVLMQEQRSIAFHNQALKEKYLHLSIYETELLALAFAMKKWRSYLLGINFDLSTSSSNSKASCLMLLTVPDPTWLDV